MVNWSARDIKKFKKEARALQQEFCNLLGDREWDVIESSEWTILRRKVGFGLFGPPSRTPKSSNRYTGYKQKQLDAIEKVCDRLVEDFNFSKRGICFSCMFVVAKVHEKRFTVPVFRAKRNAKHSWNCVYVDADGRKYSGWNDYLDNNTLPKCIYCYPTCGLYEYDSDGDVCLSFGTSPVCDFTSRVFSVTDETSKYVSIASTAVRVAALCSVPIAGPILAVATAAGTASGVYGATRSSYALYDRATHNQSIDLTDEKARGHWLSIVGSGLGLAQGRMLKSMTTAARAGDLTSKAGRIVFMVVQTGNLTVKGIGIAHSLAIMIDKAERDDLTPLDAFQFSASLLFFANTVTNFKDAKTIIKEVQHDVINSHREGLSRDALKLFNKQTGRLRGPDEMRGNAKVVQQLNRIENSRDLYEIMADRNVASHKVKLTPDGFKGKLTVNNSVRMDPLELQEIPASSRRSIFQSTRNYANGIITEDELYDELEPHCCTYHQLSERRRWRTRDSMGFL